MIFYDAQPPGRASVAPRGRRKRAPMLALLLTAAVTPARAATVPEPATPVSETTTAEGVGLQAASVLVSVVYLPFKGAMALAGGLAGGLAYAFSMGDREVAEAVWAPSFYGTYLITPEHLTGDKPVEFFGSVPPNR